MAQRAPPDECGCDGRWIMAVGNANGGAAPFWFGMLPYNYFMIASVGRCQGALFPPPATPRPRAQNGFPAQRALPATVRRPHVRPRRHIHAPAGSATPCNCVAAARPARPAGPARAANRVGRGFEICRAVRVRMHITFPPRSPMRAARIGQIRAAWRSPPANTSVANIFHAND